MSSSRTTSASPSRFFPTPYPSLDLIDPAIFNSPAGATNAAISDVAAEYLGYLDLAARATQETFIDDFAAETLKFLGFNERGTTVSTRVIIPLTICGEANRVTRTDVCHIHRPAFILFVLVDDKTLSNRTNAEPQVIAGGIAAFQFNNTKRQEHGLDPVNAMTIPAITMTGIRPAFYLVPVTLELSNAVITGQHPGIQTQLLRCATVLTHLRHANSGMEDTEYRQLALKRFLAFKTLAKSHWVKIVEGI